MDPGTLIEKSIGKFGCWQFMVVTAIFLSKFGVAWHQTVIVLAASPLNFTCSDASLKPCDTNCPSYIFDRSVFDETIITQWDLVCDREWLAQLSQTLVMLGILIGNYLFGYLADKFGRRWPLIGAVILQIFSGIGAAFAPWLWLYILLRVLSTTATGGIMITTFVILMEFTAKKYRTLVGVLFQFPFFSGYALLGLIGYLWPRWDYIQMAISIPQIILLSYICIIPESPRWLLTVGRVDATVNLLEGAAKCNRLPTENIRSEVQAFVTAAKTQDTKTANVLDLVKTKQMRTKSIGLCFNWFVIALEYYAVAQLMGSIGGNIFLNIGISGTVQLPGNFAIIFVMDRCGRKFALITSYIICAVPLIIIAVLPAEPQWPTTLMATIGLMGISMSFSIIYVYTGEMFPTVVRNIGMGITSVFGRFGSMISPQLFFLNHIQKWILPAFLGVFPVTASVVTFFFLPETLDVQMPDTIEEANELGMA